MLNGGFADIKGFDASQVSKLFQGKSLDDKSVVRELIDIKKEIEKAGENKNEKLARALFDFAKHTIKAAKDSKTAFQTIRLPGKGEVKDLREKLKKAEIKQKAEEGKKEVKQTAAKEGRRGERASRNYVIQRGKMVQKNTQQAEASQTSRAASEYPEQAAAKERVNKLLNSFEKLIVARFEQGVEVAKQNQNGKIALGEKTLAMWKGFFESMMGRTIAKKTSLEEISNFLFRGLIQKGNGKGVVISDLVLANGKIEKFIRFSVMAEALAKLRTLMPGESFSKAALEGMNDEELMYLALKASQGGEIAYSQEMAKGKFLLAGQTEAMLSHDLGVPLHTQLQQKTRMLKRKGGFGGFMGSLFENDPEMQSDPYRFVPWWHWGRLSAPVKSPKRWVTIAFYLALLAMALIGIGTMTSRLLP